MNDRTKLDSVKHLKQKHGNNILKNVLFCLNVNVSIDHSCKLGKESLNNDKKVGSFPIQIDYHQDRQHNWWPHNPVKVLVHTRVCKGNFDIYSKIVNPKENIVRSDQINFQFFCCKKMCGMSINSA